MLYPKVQTISTKGQVVIPAQFREAFGLHPQTKVLMTVLVPSNKIVLEAIDPIKALRGALKGTGSSALEIKREIRKEEAFYEKKHKYLRP